MEELSLEDNCISKLEGLHSLKNLQKLSLGHNFISTVESSGLEHLPSLVYLSLDCNRITTLAGLQKLQSLAELYVANNRIETLREVFYLKVKLAQSKNSVNSLSAFF